MTNLAAVCRHEWRLLRADGAWLLALLLFSLFTAYAAYTGSVWYRSREAAIADAIAKRDVRRTEQRTELAKTADSKPASAAMPYSPRDIAVLPPTPLTPLSIGQSDLLPFSAEVRLFTTVNGLFAPYSTDNPATLASGRFDLAFVLVFLFPLLLLALTYNLLSAEREQGTLPLALSQPLGLSTLVTGKLIVRGFALIVPVALISACAVIAAGWPVPMGEYGALLVALIVACAGYGIFWLALAALVNTYGRSSAANALALGGLWLAIAVVTPSLCNLAGQVLYPAPSRPELINEARLALVDSDKEGKQVLANLYQLHPELKPVSSQKGPIADATRQYWAVQERAENAIASQASRFSAAVQARERFADRLRFLSPAAVMQSALNEIAGTGTARHRHYQAQTRAYLEQWRRLLAPRLFQSILFTASDYDWLPRFQYREESMATRLARLTLAMAGLFAPGALVALWAALRMRRYPIAG